MPAPAWPTSSASDVPDGPDRGRLRQGQQRRRRPRRGAAAARGRPRRRRAAAGAPERADAATPRANLDRLPGRARREPFDAARARRRRSRSSTRSWAPASAASPRDPARARSRPSTRRAAGAMVFACDVPSGVNASTGEVAGDAVRARRDGDVPRRPSRACGSRRARRMPARSTVVDIGIPAGAPVAPSVGLIARAVLDAVPARGRRTRPSSPPAACSSAAARTGLTGAPCMAAEAAMRAGRGLRHRARARVAEPRLRAAAARGDDACRCPTRTGALTRPALDGRARARATAPMRSCSGPGLGRASRARSRWPASSARGRRCRCCSTPTASTRTRARLEALAGARRADGAHPARRRAGAAAGDRQRRDRRARLRCAREAAAAPARSSCSRATTRSSPAPDGRVGSQPRRRAGAGHGGHRRRALRRDRRLLAKGMDALRGRLRRRALHARAGRLPRERDRRRGRDRLRRGRCAAARAAPRESAAVTARSRLHRDGAARDWPAVNLAAIERNVRGCAPRSRAGAALCAVVKANGYGHGAVPRRGRSRAARRGWRWHRREARELRARRDRGADPGDGRAERRGAADRAGRRRRRGRLDERFVDGAAPPRAGRGRSRPRQARQRHGPLGTRDTDEALARGRRVIAPRAELELAGAMTHLATADGDLDVRGGAARGVRAVCRELRARCAGACASTPPTAPRRCACPAAISTWCAAASRSTVLTRSARTRPRRARAGAGAALLRGGAQAARAGRERRLRPPLHRRSAPTLDRHAADRLRRRLAARAHQQRRGADRRPPLPAGRDA